MTPEQLALKTQLDLVPTEWAKLTADQRRVMRETLRPKGPFTAEQREFLRDRWLPVTATQIEQMNTALPATVKVQAVTDSDGKFWLNADLLTDCMQPTDTYYPISRILATLPITFKPSPLASPGGRG